MAIHSSIFAWRIPRTEKPWGLQSMGSQRVRYDWATNTGHSKINWLHLVTNPRTGSSTCDFVTKRNYRHFHIIFQLTIDISGEGNGTPLQYSCLENPMDFQSMGSLRVRPNWATSLSLFTFLHWRRKRQPTPVFLPGESQGRGSLVGCRLWDRTELDTTEVT